MTAREDLLRATYAAFNARDIDAVLATMAPDVDWPNGWEGGRVVGHDAVRDYWTRQWAEIVPTVEPVGFAARDDGRVAVEVAQTVRSLEGDVLADGRVVHAYAFGDGGLVVRMDIEEAQPAS
jgi:ketosteroid isomerase-like protein